MSFTLRAKFLKGQKVTKAEIARNLVSLAPVCFRVFVLSNTYMISALGPWKCRVGLINGHVVPWILHLFFNSDKINDDYFSLTVMLPRFFQLITL